ncbi:hypothetical protein EYR41_004308 [Orbilia oligospora]|uniref:Uncharacterized protein n=1 Tax=Orbilia oligospora TaxID=2813651 RepID=A0A7C8PR30_ORBOL|nr:hypothetical protein TWF751_005147 [Orbilia oligospora]TGJ72411.1 hypothetical protein EYR41_004308 [Orbilia oligospora]
MPPPPAPTPPSTMPPSEPPSLPQKQPILQDAPVDDSKLKKDHKPNPVNPPRPPLISGQPIPSGDSLLRLLRSREFSDVSAVVGTGTEKRSYGLHRKILCTKSDYFAGAIHNMDTSPEIPPDSSISIRNILPPIFDLLKWIYGDVLVIERHQPLILALYRAATYLKIETLIVHIAKSVAKMLKHKRNNGASIDFDPFEIVGGLFEYAESPDHFTNLTKCTDELALQFNLPMDMVAAEMPKPEDEASEANEQFWMAIAMSYQKALPAAVCSECMSTVAEKPKTGADRICCHCDTDVKDIGVSKPPSRRPKPQVPPSPPSVAFSPSPTRESKLRRGSGSSGKEHVCRRTKET